MKVDVYQVALDFTASVEKLLEGTQARFFLKDRLDRNASGIAMHVAQAINDLAPSGRRASYRKAHAAQRQLGLLLSNLDHLRA